MEKYIVELEGIGKSFPGVRALDDVSFKLKAGEVLALLGENGAGKSTLMKILSGIYQKDQGSIKVFDKEIDDINPSLARELGIAIIHQELNMCQHLTVAENIFLGREKVRGIVLSDREMNQEAERILRRLKINIEPTTILGDLSVSKQQMIEIAKAISLSAKILIMDEPTSALTAKEIHELFKIINGLKEEGCGIVYISHRLEELEHIVDRVTILRDGQYIMTADFNSISLQEIIAHMVGRDIKEKFPTINVPLGKKILEVKNLKAGNLVKNVSFDLHEGEIVGIAGLMGAGRTETTRALFGVDDKESGEILLDGKKLTIKAPIDAIKAGIALVPEDRKLHGLCIKLSIRENISLANLDILSNFTGIVHRKKEEKVCKDSVASLRIKLSSIDQPAEGLSGGNQQKVVLAKWLCRTSRVVIFDEPTRGIDVAAKVEIYNLMNELKRQGVGVLFVSSELPEVMGISDRILVMCDGRITGCLDREEATQDLIMEYATKFESKLQGKGAIN